MISDSDFSAMKARTNAASKGPWRVDDRFCVVVENGGLLGVAPESKTTAAVFSVYDGCAPWRCPTDADGNDIDAVFIANARTDMETLIAEVERLKALIGEDHDVPTDTNAR